jgi:phytoene/squalene synthetase
MNQRALDLSGRDIGHAKAHQAADRAGAAWQEAAMEALRSFAQQHSQFTVEDVRNAFPTIKAPTDKAWGSIAIRARNAGLIAAVGNIKVQGGRMVATLWQSRLRGAV